MKTTILSILLCFLGHQAVSAEISSQEQVAKQRQSLYQSFLTPPDSIRVGCYYYWINERVDPKGRRGRTSSG